LEVWFSSDNHRLITAIGIALLMVFAGDLLAKINAVTLKGFHKNSCSYFNNVISILLYYLRNVTFYRILLK